MSGVPVKTRTEIYLDIMGSLKWLPEGRRDELTDFIYTLIERAAAMAEKRVRDEKEGARYDEIEAAREEGYDEGYDEGYSDGYREGRRSAEKDD
jgi:flagellar biosynthesis/type III secretory pathway protein FliH